MSTALISQQVQIVASDPNISLHNPSYLALYLTCAMEVHLSGAAKYLYSIWCNMDSLDVPDKDGGSANVQYDH